MSLTFSHVIGGVLLYCAHPAENVLPRGFICEIGLDKITFYLTELNLTDENWLLMKRDVHVDPSRAEYPLSSFPAFGRPVLVETKDDANPYHTRREIDIIDFQDRKLLYDGSNTQPGGATHNARSVSLYERDGAKRLLFDPMPGMAAAYTVYYEPNRIVPQSLTDSAFPLEQFGGLLKAEIAKPCLAHCGYEDGKHKRLMEAVDAEIQGYRQQFERYIKQDAQPKTAMARGFMTDDMSVWEY